MDDTYRAFAELLAAMHVYLAVELNEIHSLSGATRVFVPDCRTTSGLSRVK